MAELWKGLGKYAAVGEYVPIAGDLVFYNNNTVGIVTEINAFTFCVVRGDVEGTVQSEVVDLTDDSISGWGITVEIIHSDGSPKSEESIDITKEPATEELVDITKEPTSEELLDITNGPAFFIFEGGTTQEQTQLQLYSLKSSRAIINLVEYLEANGGNYFFTLLDTNNQELPKDEKGNYIYSFSGNDLFETVQQGIDAAKAEGADYIIALSHLGTEFVFEQWSAQALVKNTAGFDAVLDAHSHSIVESMTVNDKNGDEVIISSTGTKFANIGKLTVSDGKITTQLIPTESYDKTDAAIDEYIAKINEEYQKLGDRVIGSSKYDLITVDKDGKRIIRHLETNLGDLCADAFRIVTDSDIGVVNGGGIRSDIAAGDITFNDLLTVYPWNNTVCAAKATGQQIIDLLELGVMFYPDENGGFQHVSGLTLRSTAPSRLR